MPGQLSIAIYDQSADDAALFWRCRALMSPFLTSSTTEVEQPNSRYNICMSDSTAPPATRTGVQCSASTCLLSAEQPHLLMHHLLKQQTPNQMPCNVVQICCTCASSTVNCRGCTWRPTLASFIPPSTHTYWSVHRNTTMYCSMAQWTWTTEC